MKFGLKVDEVQAKIHQIWVGVTLAVEGHFSRIVLDEMGDLLSRHFTFRCSLHGQTSPDLFARRSAVRRKSLVHSSRSHSRVRDFPSVINSISRIRRRENCFFTSPTIAYAAQHHYATPLRFTSPVDKVVYLVQVVLRCRQMPGTFVEQGGTVNNGPVPLPAEGMEWKTSQRGTVIFDGVCLRLLADQSRNECLVHQSIST